MTRARFLALAIGVGVALLAPIAWVVISPPRVKDPTNVADLSKIPAPPPAPLMASEMPSVPFDREKWQSILNAKDKTCVAQAGVHEDAGSVEALAGTYTLQICRDNCGGVESSGAYITGTLVLFDRLFPTSDLPPDTRRDFEFDFIDLADEPQADGCFVLERRQTVNSYAHLTPVGLTKWRRGDDDAINLSLARTPDSGYSITVRPFGTTLAGHGESWGVGAAETDAPPDCVVARRTGVPEIAPCVRAMRRQQRSGG